MERLTIDEIIEHCDRKIEMHEKTCDIKHLKTATMNNPIKEYWEHKQVAEYLRKLKEYEDLEEQGRLVKLPCKVGNTYYSIEVNTDSCEECNFFHKGYCCDDWCNNKTVLDENGDTLINPQYSDKVFCKNHFYEINRCCFDNIDKIFNLREQFGKTVFLTKSEAEAKLKEMRGSNND